MSSFFMATNSVLMQKKRFYPKTSKISFFFALSNEKLHPYDGFSDYS